MKFSEIILPSNRKFGFFFTSVFIASGGYFLIENSTYTALAFFGAGALFLVITLLKADLFLPINKLWMGFGMLLGIIVSPIVLGIIYFGLFSPIALGMRLFGRDELRLKFKTRTSHWKLKLPIDYSSDTFKNQF
jgi:hypothetical protein